MKLGGVLWRKLRRDLWARKGAAASLLLIVMIGSSSYLGMASVYLDLDGARARYYAAERLADFVVDLKRMPQTALEGLESRARGVERLHGRVRAPALLDLPGKVEPISGTAISLPFERRPVLNDARLLSGAWFSDPDAREAILNDSFAKANGLRPGDRIKALLADRQHELLVVGTAMSPEFVYLLPPGGALAPDPERFGVLYLPERFLQRSADLAGAYNQVLGTSAMPGERAIEGAMDAAAFQMERYGVENKTLASKLPSVEFLAAELDGLRVSATVVPVLFLGVAALALNVLLGRMVAQQRSTAGALKALGYSTPEVMAHYMMFGLALGLLGAVLGALMGAWLQGAFLGIYREIYSIPGMEKGFYPAKLAAVGAMCAAFGVAGAARAAWSAARMRPAEAMSPPPPEKGGRIFLERFAGFWGRLSFRWKMILRAIFRNPFRSMATVAGTAISGALVFAMLSTYDSAVYIIDYEFKRVARHDVSISLREPEDGRTLRQVADLPGVESVEAQLGVVADLSLGAASERAGIVGFDPGSRLFVPRDSSGAPIVLPAEGLVLTKALAEKLGAKRGDFLRAKPLMGQRREVRAEIVLVVDSYLGLSAYADRAWLSRLLGEAPVANTVLATTRDGLASDALLSAVKERQGVVGLEQRQRALDQFEEVFGQTMVASIAVVVFFAGMMAFGNSLNQALASLSEREREVGTLRVLGYEPGQVAALFAGESLLLNGAGVALGLLGGVGLAHLMSVAYATDIFRFPVVIRPWQFAATALILAAFAALAQAAVFFLTRRFDWLSVLMLKE